MSLPLVAVVVAGLAVTVGAPTASADTAPKPPVTTPTVSADALPTVQINGLVRDQVTVGNRVYVTGEFTSARPAGSPAGTNEVARSNILAFDVTTGALISSWAPSLNGAGKAIVASADGTKIYVGGSFTSVSGVSKYRIVALDATTGAVLTAFKAGTNARVNTLAVSGNTVYAGGVFTTMGTSDRVRLAAVDGTTGATLAWNPGADAEVMALVAPAGSGNVVAGGKFAKLGTTDAYGMGAIDASTGAIKPWAINQTVRNGGADAAIFSLSTDGAQVYGTGYTFGGGGNFEGTFAARSSDGAIVYVTGGRGDSYDSQPLNGVLYYVGHAHQLDMIGGHPQTDPWTFQRALAQTTGRGQGDAINHGGTFSGAPAPELLHWLPSLAVGTYTGSSQAAWSVTGNSDYVVLGGEFPSVNGTAQQGLVRFAVRAKAPNKEGPIGYNDITPKLVSTTAGRVRVSWTAAWDEDNRNLTYQVLRGSSLANSSVIATLSADSNWWTRPQLFFNDSGLPAGSSQSYRIRVTDPLGNTFTGQPAAITVPAGNATSSVYADKVLGDGASHYWRLGEPSGTGSYDLAAADDLTLDSSATRGVTPGALLNETSAAATTFAGTANIPGSSPTAVPGPQTFGQELWFKTTTTSGGKLLGFGNSNTGDSGGYDRHVYMLNDGRIVFGVYNNNTSIVVSPTALNDGQWHQVATGFDATGMVLYVDGKRVGRNASATFAQDYSGYWRIGGDNLNGWPGQPSSSKFAGTIQDVSIFGAPLSLTQVQQHYEASGRSLNLPTRPTDAYGSAVWDSQPSLFWRLDETSGTQALDRATNTANGGTYSSGTVLGEPGAPANASGKSIRFPGTSEENLVATAVSDNPTTFSLETWFKTTTTQGGRLIGFGRSNTQASSGSYDRHIYMLNSGQLRYGIYDGNTRTVDTPAAYNDGNWHLVTATQSPGTAQKLYVDGVLVNTGGGTSPENYPGYWRLGTDNTWGGADTNNFAGSLDEAAVYDSVLSDTTVNQHYQLGKPAAPNQSPVAAFTSTTSNRTASFDGSTSSDPDGSIASYDWAFGDGTTGSGATPSHTYATAGTYTAVLTVKDNGGATTSVSHPVTVTDPPNQAPTAAFTSTTSKLKATFDSTGSSDPDGTIASYAWAFGDGTTATTANPTHTYATAGTFTATLTVTDNGGATSALVTHDVTVTGNVAPSPAFTSSCTNLGCTFNGSGSADSDGTITAYGWDFGDGSTASGATTSHTYTAAGTFTVTLTVKDDDNTTSATQQTVTVSPANNPPTAVAAGTCTDLKCTFNGSGSTDSDGTIASYAWDFGDNSAGAGVTPPVHTYAAAGTYTAVLTVTDNKGATGTASKVVTVTAPNQAPNALFTPTCTELACSFDATASSDPDGSIVSYAWDYGDQTTGTGVTSTHTYAAGGSYTVTLTVTDDKGATKVATAQITPAVTPNQAPTAAFTSSCSVATCSFDSSASTDPDGSIVPGRVWDFGDGQTGTGTTVSHTYTTAGTYQVKLTVTDDKSATGTVTHPVTVTTPPVNQAPTASFTATSNALVASFNGTGSSDPDGTIASYAWSFGDATSDTGPTPSHTYATAGTYQVTLTVTDNSGGTNSTSSNVTVTAAPGALATDDFGRTLASGWGSADTGGAWTVTGTGTTTAVNSGSGKVTLGAGRTNVALLSGVQNISTDVTHTVWAETVPSGTAYLAAIVRDTPTGEYRARVKLTSTGAVQFQLFKSVGGTDTALGSVVTLTGVTYTANQQLSVRVQAQGTAPTTLRAKVWLTGGTEPAWQTTVTDNTAGLQQTGAVGFTSYASAALAVRYDALKVTSLP